jgi:hypothetical protein
VVKRVSNIYIKGISFIRKDSFLSFLLGQGEKWKEK